MVGFCQTKKIEVVVLRNLASNEINENDQAQFEDNTLANTNRKKATIIHNEEVKNRVIHC
jgi:5-methyltetrahydropteroyltriglutamate--homocysteine methyltransferase